MSLKESYGPERLCHEAMIEKIRSPSLILSLCSDLLIVIVCTLGRELFSKSKPRRSQESGEKLFGSLCTDKLEALICKGFEASAGVDLLFIGKSILNLVITMHRFSNYLSPNCDALLTLILNS
ncbi:Pentatricopeptide repeat superfamily protein [Prunus dulcis]|uniref:Pentatricopeptide repeat superfamily protein n=1 Tax=Prunus dulcis TaxID=3755 RepID=A0A4Y1R5R5_PRUDU|nr:Pentatricopeptide repeat superfamily protein [Prunus dulcis]